MDADFSFKAYDGYLEHINARTNRTGTSIDYVCADEFIRILNKAEKNFEGRKEGDDFFPYRDNVNDYWTGYFTTHPFLKKLVMDNGRLI